MNHKIFCSKKGHQIYPLEIERIDKSGNVFVRPCKECEEEISDIVDQGIDEYKNWHSISENDIDEIRDDCEKGENLLTDVINALEADGLASAEMLNILEEVKCCFWSIEGNI